MSGIKAHQLHTDVTNDLGSEEKAVQTIAAGGTIAIGSNNLQILPVKGDSAAVTTSTTPFGTTPPSNGTRIILVGDDDTNTVTVPVTDVANGCLLNGSAALKKGFLLEVIWVGATARYVEIARNF